MRDTGDLRQSLLELGQAWPQAQVITPEDVQHG
jgi:hypothetical protein